MKRFDNRMVFDNRISLKFPHGTQKILAGKLELRPQQLSLLLKKAPELLDALELVIQTKEHYLNRSNLIRLLKDDSINE